MDRHRHAAAKCGNQVGDRVTAGDIYATVPENTLIEHRIMLPPGARGNVTWLAPAGEYNIDEEVIEVEFGGVKKVRPRPALPSAAFCVAAVCEGSSGEGLWDERTMCVPLCEPQSSACG